MASACMPERFFDAVSHHLPPEPPVGPKGGRPRFGYHAVIRVIWFVLKAVARWEDVPMELGCWGRTAHGRLCVWEEPAICLVPGTPYLILDRSSGATIPNS